MKEQDGACRVSYLVIDGISIGRKKIIYHLDWQIDDDVPRNYS